MATHAPGATDLNLPDYGGQVVLESTSDGVVLLGADWRFLYLNPAAEILLARTLLDVKSNTFWEEFPGLIGTEFETLYRRVMAQQLPGTMLGFYPDHQRWYDIRAYPAQHGLSIYFRDCTEAQLAASALQAAQARWHLALDSGGLGTWNMDPVAMTLTGDERFRLLFSGSTKPLNYEEMVMRVHPDDRDRVLRNVAATLDVDDPQPYSEEYRVIHQDGTERWVLAMGRLNFQESHSESRVASFDGTVADITGRKAVEQQLQHAEQQFRMLADNMPQLAWIVESGSDGQASWFNKSWLDYTGASLEDMQGDGWRKVHHPGHADRVIARFVHHVQHGLDWEDTFPLRGKDGKFRWFLSRMNVIRNEAGMVSQIFGTNTDITEQREMSERLAQQAQALAETDRRKDEFLATLSHELRNPLAPIRNSLRIMRQTNDGATVGHALLVVERQVAQMVRLVDDLMDVSRVSHGKLELQKAEVDLFAALTSAREAAEPIFASNRVDLKIDKPLDTLLVHGDFTRLTQVFLNLLNNAAKFTPAGGSVTVDTSVTDGEVAVRVTDTGMGIADADLDDIFQMFNQRQAALDRTQGGLGIGLALVRSLVELHGGSVRVRSDGPGKGSEFAVVLPVRTVQPADAVPLNPPELPPAARSRILVVDDNQDAADSLAMLLELIGYETHAVYNGFDAVGAALSYLPEIVVLDIGMPGLNGYQVARAIRLQPTGASMKIVALTGWGQKEDIDRAFEAGFDRHFVKPVDSLLLEELLAEWSARPAG